MSDCVFFYLAIIVSRSQGGVEFPTGGRWILHKPASAFLIIRKGQQIRSKSWADGYSPDDRERTQASTILKCCSAFVIALVTCLG